MRYFLKIPFTSFQVVKIILLLDSLVLVKDQFVACAVQRLQTSVELCLVSPVEVLWECFWPHWLWDVVNSMQHLYCDCPGSCDSFPLSLDFAKKGVVRLAHFLCCPLVHIVAAGDHDDPYRFWIRLPRMIHVFGMRLLSARSALSARNLLALLFQWSLVLLHFTAQGSHYLWLSP